MKAARETLRTLHVAEPPANYLVRPPVVVDCSAICAVLFDEAERADAAAQMAGKTLFAPYLLDHEVISVALKKRRLQWPAESLALALGNYENWHIEMRETNPQAQYELAARYQLTSYDAAYLWLAGELKAPLATFDQKLATAARVHLASLP